MTETSIFNLPNDLAELPSVNQGIDEYKYRKVVPLKGVSGTAFPGNDIHFKWTTSRSDWWVPARSYFRIRCKLTKQAGAQLVLSDGIAPNMNMAATLFETIKFFINDVEVTGINSYLPQVDTLETRMSKSKEWLDGIGARINWWSGDLSNRINDVSSDGVEPGIRPSATAETIIPRSGALPNGLGFDAATNEIAVAANKTITFTKNAGADLFDLRTVFQQGDTIQTSAGHRYTVNVVNGPGDVNTQTMTVFETPVVEAAAGGAFSRRRTVTTINPTPTERVYGFELIYQPNLAIFKSQYAMPIGKYEFRLHPQSAANYKKYCIESIADQSALANHNVLIENVDLFLSTMKAGQMKDGQYMLDLDETVCNVRNIPSSAGITLGDLTQEISQSTYAITVAMQDSRAGNNTKFSVTKFKIDGEAERKLNRLQIMYADEAKPSPMSDLSYFTGIDFLTQRYMDTNLYNGMMWNGSPESYKDWLKDRGMYFFFPYPKDGSNTNTTMTLHYGFSDQVNNGRFLIFHHKKRIVRVKIEASTVTEVQVFDR